MLLLRWCQRFAESVGQRSPEVAHFETYPGGPGVGQGKKHLLDMSERQISTTFNSDTKIKRFCYHRGTRFALKTWRYILKLFSTESLTSSSWLEYLRCCCQMHSTWGNLAACNIKNWCVPQTQQTKLVRVPFQISAIWDSFLQIPLRSHGMSRFSFSLGSWKLPFEDQAIGLAIERRKEKESEDSADFHVAKPKERKLGYEPKPTWFLRRWI